MNLKYLLPMIASLAGAVAGESVTSVPRPDASQTSPLYVGNRAPLLPSPFLKLPIGAIKPEGWLREYLDRQRDGLTGHLQEISIWLTKKDNAWLSRDGKGQWGWEEVPYWLRGYGDLAYLLGDPKMLAETKVWIDGAINSQRPDGDFGPDRRFDDDGTRDFWANMLMLFALQSYYDRTGDQRVIDLMTKYFRYQLGLPDDQFLTHYWQKMRGGDNLYSVYWLYNRTGDKFLLDLADKIHRCTANWEIPGSLPNWHNVNVAQCFREPAERYLQTHDKKDLDATYADFAEVRKRYGQVPGGMWGGDENSRPGYDDPHQAIETCGMVEHMLSDEILLRETGDPFWADHCEEVAFNDYPAAVMPDFRALRYLTAPNMALSDNLNHAPGIQNAGPFLFMNPLISRCCQHNHSIGWPYFAENLWLATSDRGLCAALYAPCEVTAKVGGGAEVTIAEQTQYPFRDTLDFSLRLAKPERFPLYLRVPAWCSAPHLAINGEDVPVAAREGGYLRIDRAWNDGDTIALRLPFELKVRRWTKNHDSASVDYGPLTFSLRIKEDTEVVDSTKNVMSDSAWQPGLDTSKWPSTILKPGSPWNYALVLSESGPAASFHVETRPWPKDDFPFTQESVPLLIRAKGRKVPQWRLDQHALAAALQDSPVKTGTPVEDITLVPMGAARLRISAFPVAGDGPDAHVWKEPLRPKMQKFQIQASASHVDGSLDALSDDELPKASNDEVIPRFTWWDRTGSTEWVEYDFGAPQKVSGVSVYWFDDTGSGRCRVPQSWRLLYKDGERWKPADVTGYGTAKDALNAVRFPAVTTTALRIEAQLRPGMSGGILEWQVDD